MCALAVLSSAQAETQATVRDDARRATWLDFDPFLPPSQLTPMVDLRARVRVAVSGTVVAVSRTRWDGGPALEVTLEDKTGSLVLAFLGRRRISGIEDGRRLVAGGRVLSHRGRLLLLNPFVWFAVSDPSDEISVD
jgi:hypothetical protein